MSSLQIAILRTLAYYDIFDYPLTVAELWRWIYFVPGQAVPVTREEIESVLQSTELQDRISRVDEYVVIRGREEIVSLRQQRHAFGTKKWRRAISGAQFLEIVPFVKMVAVSNTLAIDNAKITSDIDYLVVTSPGYIWLTRMMVTGVISLLGLRRHGDKIQDRICLSFYTTTEAMNFEKIMQSPSDAHRLFLTPQIVPLMDDENTYAAYKIANSWVTQSLPNAWEWPWQERLLKPNTFYRSLKHAFEQTFQVSFGLILEGLARDRQLKKMAGNTNSRAAEPTNDVIINESMLKFHENNRLAENNQKFQRRLAELGIL